MGAGAESEGYGAPGNQQTWGFAVSQIVSTDVDVQPLRASVEGQVIAPNDAAYDEARKVWNGLIDRYPAVVVRCAATSDVVAAVNFARERGLIIAVRCGAHSTPGYSTCDAGVVIDLRGLNHVSVDAQARTARVGGGAIWSELDAATQEHGLAVTGGRVSDTGVGGLALGSGSGWLERMYGYTAESMVSAQVVTATGEVVTASASENPELFFALRGGGGNFGVVTEFEFDLHPVGPIMAGGMLLWPRAQAGEVIRFYREFIAEAPQQVGGGVALLTAPPEPFVPAELQGQPAVGVVYCYVGSPEEGLAAAAPLREFGAPAVDLIQPMPYVALQTMLDAGNPTGIREYFKVDWLRDLPDEAIDTVVAQGEKLPAPFGQLILAPLGGAARGSRADVALAAADAPWMYFCLSMWMDPTQDEGNRDWARGFAAAMQRFGVGRAFANFIEPDEGGRLRASYGEQKYARLVEAKRHWDPDNLFRLNQNIAVNGS
jgi:FAD/FMN-containing dehydrogenase